MRTDCVTRWKVERNTGALTECGPRMKPCRSRPGSCRFVDFRVQYLSGDCRCKPRQKRGMHEAYTTVRSRTARLLCCPMLHAAERAARSVPKPATWQHLRHYMADEQHVLTSLAVTRNGLLGAAEPASDKPQLRLLVSCRASGQPRLCTSLVATAAPAKTAHRHHTTHTHTRNSGPHGAISHLSPTSQPCCNTTTATGADTV